MLRSRDLDHCEFVTMDSQYSEGISRLGASGHGQVQSRLSNLEFSYASYSGDMTSPHDGEGTDDFSRFD